LIVVNRSERQQNEEGEERLKFIKRKGDFLWQEPQSFFSRDNMSINWSGLILDGGETNFFPVDVMTGIVIHLKGKKNLVLTFPEMVSNG
jgi:hypothetical protein